MTDRSPATDIAPPQPAAVAGALQAPADLARACADAAEWPLPGHGASDRRLRLLAAEARRDLVLGRLVEAHADALAILAELTGTPPAIAGTRRRWGVWAAGPPTAVRADAAGAGWSLRGRKRWCSGATFLTHALVDATTDSGQQLMAVDLSHPAVVVGDPDWVGPGMAGTDTRTVEFHGVPGDGVGPPDAYVARPGFWMGAIGVAACWHGGMVAVAEPLRRAAEIRADTHRLVHLAAVHVAIEQNRAHLDQAAQCLDAAPTADHAVLARTVRAAVERNAATVIDRVGRALGPEPLAHDARHAGLVADLHVYLRQHHAERDLEALGADLLTQGPSWSD